jgi:hypothetical protein
VAQAADLAVDDVEAIRERVVVGDVEEATRRDQGGPGEVQPGDDGPAPGPGQGVQADVAHQVQQALPAHVADLPRFERAQRVLSRQEPGNVVEPVRGVHRCPLVPPGPVEPQPVVRRG